MLGYLGPDGRPLVAPVWFIVDNGQLGVQHRKKSAKGRALARDPRVVLCVDDPQPPYSFVQVQGLAEMTNDPKELLDVATRAGARYMGPDRAEEFGRRNDVANELRPQPMVVRVTPTKVVAAFNLAPPKRGD